MQWRAAATDKGMLAATISWLRGLINAESAVTANTTWISYSDAAHSTIVNDFSDFSTQHTAYMYGTGYLPGHSYQVAYYDGSNNKVATDYATSEGSGTLHSQHTFIHGTDLPGTWHVIVGEPEFSLPGVYVSTSPYEIVKRHLHRPGFGNRNIRSNGRVYR
jgi:hypothetical protein